MIWRHPVAGHLRQGIVDRVDAITLDGEVECDDGFHEIHVNTMEGVWSLLRSWLRPHRGIFEEKLPLYLAFFEFIHNARKRGTALFESLIKTLLNPSTRKRV